MMIERTHDGLAQADAHPVITFSRRALCNAFKAHDAERAEAA